MARLVLLVLSAVLFTSEGLAQDAEHKPHKHHKHHKKHQSQIQTSDSASATVTVLDNSTGQATDKKDAYVVRMFDHIQKTLSDAWKHKDHLDSLQKTVTTEEGLLSQQQQLLQASGDDFSITQAKSQVAETVKMIDQARKLIKGDKDAAVQSTHKAETEAEFVKKQAEKEEAAEDAVIAKAMAAKEVAKRRLAQADTAIAGANEEMKFFLAKYKDAGSEASAAASPKA